ncbi:MAG: rhamnulokinase family protein [Bacteroidales bacterium]|nr:rhamnulokinase family protein [Bacteroidales bacterium]
MSHTYIAVDFGAGSGRVIAAQIVDGALKMEEVHRFGNTQVRLGGHIYWNFLSLFTEMKKGLRLAVKKGYDIRSIGIDTWGVDFGLIDRQGNLLGNPVCYRDPRTNGLPEQTFTTDELRQHYGEAGIQVMPINSLFQLCSMKRASDATLEAADRLLFMPDLFSYFLTGVANNEYCIASTSELLDARSRTWNRALIERLGLPQHIFGDIVMPGTVRGKVLPEICEETGLPADVEVIAVGSHDTASAVFAVPESDKPRAYLSSGTWSLLGVELDEPILTEAARLGGFTNEGGVGGKIRFLQNITGLWMLQRLIAQWQEAGLDCDYDYLIGEAEKCLIPTVVDVDAQDFQSPTDMAKAIADYCRARNLQVPEGQGEYVRVVLQSLAQRYKTAIEGLNALLPQPVGQLNIVGGGSRNKLLNRLTEEATGLPVCTGPVEATAIGNILLQAIAVGDISHKGDVSLASEK